jgi:hypothetical protein
MKSVLETLAEMLEELQLFASRPCWYEDEPAFLVTEKMLEEKTTQVGILPGGSVIQREE